MCAEFKKAEEKVKKPPNELKSRGKRKTVGLKHQEIFDAILDAAVTPRLGDSIEGPPEVRDWVR